jgi:hypothetical protein
VKLDSIKVNFLALSSHHRATKSWGGPAVRTEWPRLCHSELPLSSFETKGELSGTCGFRWGKVNLQASQSELSGQKERTFRHGKVNLQALLNRKQDVHEVQEVVAGCSGCACSGICGNSPDSSSPRIQIPWLYGSAVKVPCICNDQWEKLVRPLGATWRPEECVRLVRVPGETWTSARAIHSASWELKNSYQFHVNIQMQ